MEHAASAGAIFEDLREGLATVHLRHLEIGHDDIERLAARCTFAHEMTACRPSLASTTVNCDLSARTMLRRSCGESSTKSTRNRSLIWAGWSRLSSLVAPHYKTVTAFTPPVC